MLYKLIFKADSVNVMPRDEYWVYCETIYKAHTGGNALSLTPNSRSLL